MPEILYYIKAPGFIPLENEPSQSSFRDLSHIWNLRLRSSTRIKVITEIPPEEGIPLPKHQVFPPLTYNLNSTKSVNCNLKSGIMKIKNTSNQIKKEGSARHLPAFFVALLLTAGLLIQGCEAEESSDFEKSTEDAAMKAAKMKMVDLELIAKGMVSPIGLVAVPDDSERLFVIDQIGKIWVIDPDKGKLQEPFLDVSSQMTPLNAGYDERGLLGLAFHPDYESNGRVFTYYTAPPDAGGPEGGGTWNNISRISEFSVSPSDPDMALPGSERIILEIDQPQRNHEGGTIAFGPDGYLYISIGDGGGADDTGDGHVEDWYLANEGGNGQDNEDNLLGNILRIDIDGKQPYGIPADNPFVGKPELDEIYAFGFRNPYRFSFDMSGSRKMYVGDAGQHLWEEISVVEKGGNYGWNVKEGTHCFDAENPSQVLPSCPDVDPDGNQLIDPVIEMANSHNPNGGRTVTIIGGYVYRGNDIPGFQGKYIFGSFSHNFGPTGELFIANPAGPGLWPFLEIKLESSPDDIGHYLKGFGQDLDGEVYVTASDVLGPSGDTGRVLKLVHVKKGKESL